MVVVQPRRKISDIFRTKRSDNCFLSLFRFKLFSLSFTAYCKNYSKTLRPISRLSELCYNPIEHISRLSELCYNPVEHISRLSELCYNPIEHISRLSELCYNPIEHIGFLSELCYNPIEHISRLSKLCYNPSRAHQGCRELQQT